jgi:hypothetical protein
MTRRSKWSAHSSAAGRSATFATLTARVNLGLHQFDFNVLWGLGPHDFSIAGLAR